ncbi:hypothetical protein AVEN_203677-1 [Araneus ventricosus]|uniref:Uncharacterized protein n=1 Tax=Araneus ventricosus TaxID=182803 RepID=A0A4Y2EWI6_ARAVE|nr:hypothetical protein AVEN_203677-1 [Araneus ventricosus]
MTPFEELRVSCFFTDTDIVESECIYRSWSACWREASSTSKPPEHVSLVDVTVSTLPVMAFLPRKGETLPKFSLFPDIHFMMKNVLKFRSEDCPLRGGFFGGTLQKGIRDPTAPPTTETNMGRQ